MRVQERDYGRQEKSGAYTTKLRDATALRRFTDLSRPGWLLRSDDGVLELENIMGRAHVQS